MPKKFVARPYQRYAIEKIIADLFKEINNGKPVDDSNIKQVAMKYLTEKVGLIQEQIAQLQEKLK